MEILGGCSMRTRVHRIAIGSALCLAFVVASCGSPGPLTLQLAESQSLSGINRTMATGDSAPADLDAVTYSVVGNLSTPRVSGFAFSIGSKPEAKDWLRRLATAVNVQGDIVKDSSNNFTIGLNKDTGAGVWLWADDAGSWWSYNSGTSSAGVSTSPCDPNTSDCSQAPAAPPTTVAPTNLLPATEAVAQATRFLLQVGFELKGFRLRGTETPYATFVEGELVVSNVPTNLMFRFTFEQDGVMTNASGPLVTLKRANGYYLITPQEGIERLKNPRYTSIGATSRAAAEVASSPAPGGTTGPIAVSISRVEYTLMQSVLANTTTILLPAYTYFNDDGVVGTVIAMKDEDLTFNSLPVTSDEPSTLNNGGVPGGGASVGVPETGAIAPLTSETAAVLVGLEEEKAVSTATSNGWTTRVRMRDGKSFPLTMEYNGLRVNLTVVKGLVTAVDIG